MGVEADYILGKLRTIETLPTFPGIVGEVINVIEDPMSSATDLAKSMDPSMAGEVLRIANTAYFGTGNFRNITSIEHAIAIVGFQHLSHIILQMPFVSMIKGDTGFDRAQFVAHSITCGNLAKAISSCISTTNPNEIYISGLMHDVGSIILYRYFHDEWERINSVIAESGVNRTEAEVRVLSVDHGVIGGMLLQLWNIPKMISDPVMYHHNPDGAGENRKPAIVVSLGNKFAKNVDLRDNFFSFDEFLNKYRDFGVIAQDLDIDLKPSEQLRFFERAFTFLKDTKGFLEGVLEERHD